MSGYNWHLLIKITATKYKKKYKNMDFARFNLASPYIQAVEISRIKKTLQILTPFKYKNRLYIWRFKLRFYTLQYAKMKNLTVNNVNFEVKNFTIPNGLCYFYHLYDKPSTTKIEIYEEWRQKLNEIYGCTGSKFAFTIYGNIKDETTWQLYDVRISKEHNYIK